MSLADSSYPLLNLFWTMCILFLWVIWIWILIWVFIDIFRSHDLSGGAKALWFVFVLFIPLIGVLVYLFPASLARPQVRNSWKPWPCGGLGGGYRFPVARGAWVNGDDRSGVVRGGPDLGARGRL